MANKKLKWKRDDNISELLGFLRTQKELTFKTLKEKLEVSDPTLNEYIKILLGKGEIEAFTKPEDRRNTWYRIKPESEAQVQNKLGKYEAIKFIKNILNPVYGYAEKEKKSIAVFSSRPATVNPKEYEKSVQYVTEKFLKYLPEKLLKLPKGENERVAVVIMVKGKGE